MSSATRLGVAAVVALNLWLALSVFQPIGREPPMPDYLLVSAPFGWLFGLLAASVAALFAVGRWLRSRGADDAAFTRTLGWTAISLLPLLTLVDRPMRSISALWYVVADLNWTFWLIVIAAGWLAAHARSKRPVSPGRLPIAALAILPVVAAVAFTPNLRFSGALHGDEPKFVRYCENFFQGLGFDLAAKQPLTAPGVNVPHVSGNLDAFFRAIGEEAPAIVADLKRAVGLPAAPRLRSGEPTEQMFFPGKHPGTVYQLHNPGLSFLLFPGYYIDRRFTGSGIGYQDEFPDSMPAVSVTLLALFAGYVLALYWLLRKVTGHRTLAWTCAALGALTLPVSAFAFQIYPEIAAGIIVSLVAGRLLSETTPARTSGEFWFGALAGFMPWLHVRFVLLTLVFAGWRWLAPAVSRKGRLAFALGACGGVAALSLYTYRLTGSLLPMSTYGAEAPLSIARVLHGVPAFFFDRTWGLFPHAPIYLLAATGLATFWQHRRRQGVFILLVLAAVILPAAAHGYWAGGSTPGRYLVAAVPLFVVLVANAVWIGRMSRPFTAIFAVLAAISVETAIRYNLGHIRGVGPITADGFSGWRPNLLFPALGTTWPVAGRDLTLLALWVVGAAAAAMAPLTWRRRSALKTLPSAGAGVYRLRVGDAVGVLAGIVVFAAVVGSLTAETRKADYMLPARQARQRALSAFASWPGCALCYSSEAGRVDPLRLLGNTPALVDLRFDPAMAIAGRDVLVRVRPRSTTGEYMFGQIALDFGDGTRDVRPRYFGDLETLHRYARPGDYDVLAAITAPGFPEIVSRLVLHVSTGGLP